MFRKKKKQETYDREKQKTVIRASICNGEQVAGFQDIHTGKFHEVQLIRNDRDLEEFLERYGIDEANVGRTY